MKTHKHLVWLLGIALSGALFLAGCATPYKPAYVEGKFIKNPTVSWKGYEIAIPEGYTVFVPGKDTPESSQVRSLIKDGLSLPLGPTDKPGSVEVKDVTFLVNEAKQQGGVFGICLLPSIEMPFSRFEEPKQRLLMEWALGAIPSDKFTDKRVFMYRNLVCSSFVRHIPQNEAPGLSTDFRLECIMVLGAVDEMYLLILGGPETQTAELKQALETMLASLKF